VGIIKMKALPYTNPTSWGYQAAIHGTTQTDNLLSWNTCHKVGETYFFLAWHRMYCYFFERILRAKSGRANLTLPYWNYQTNAVLPAAYRDKTATNPLYDATRTATINNGGALPASIMTAFNNSLDIVSFTNFQNNLSSGPHGSVHSTIAGNMAIVTTAAKDPVFWLHHSNIDRLWEFWLSKCGGRANPTTDPTWLNKSYTFFDENGTAVSLQGSQIIEIANQLNYNMIRYPLPLPVRER
jgi:tyrosinase